MACFLRGRTTENLKVRLYHRAEHFALRWADQVVCLSETQRARLTRERALSGKLALVINAIEATEISAPQRAEARGQLRSRFGFDAEVPVVVSAGRLSPEKGAEHFLAAAAGVLPQLPSARFVLFGDGPERDALTALAQRLALGDRLCFAGHTADFAALLPGADLLVNASLSEEMPNVVLEAMAAGVPVVATAVGAVAEIAGDPPALALVPPANAERIAGEALRLLRDPAAAQQQAEAAQQRLRQAYSPAAQQQQLRELHRSLLAARGGESRAAKAAGAGLPFISVVIPVRNEAAHIGKVLEQLLAQEYPRDRYEIIVADGGSTDGTPAVVERCAAMTPVLIRRLPNPQRLSSAGRNVGIRNARGDVVVFVDGHCHIPSRTWLADTAAVFAETGADCLCRPQPLNFPGNTWFQQLAADVRASALGHGTDSTIYGLNYAGPVNPSSSGAIYRREVLERVGLYDESFDACEDVEFNHRVHRVAKSWLDPRLAVYYQPRGSLIGLWKQMRRYGRGRFRLVRKHPDAFSISQLVPAGLWLWILVAGVAALSWPLARWLLAASAGLYLGAVLISSLTVSLGRGWRQWLMAPWVYFAVHFGLGAGFWEELLRAPFARRRAADVVSAAAHAPAKSGSEDESNRESTNPGHLTTAVRR